MNSPFRLPACYLHQGVFRRPTSPGSEKLDVPTLIIHGDDDQTCVADSALLLAKIVKNAKLKSTRRAARLCTTHKNLVKRGLARVHQA